MSSSTGLTYVSFEASLRELGTLRKVTSKINIVSARTLSNVRQGVLTPPTQRVLQTQRSAPNQEEKKLDLARVITHRFTKEVSKVPRLESFLEGG